MASSQSGYSVQRVALVTQHSRHVPLGEFLSQWLHCHLEHVIEYDTDQLDTFTRDMVRSGSQLDPPLEPRH